MSTFALPDLGEGLQEAEIVSWHVAEGDHVVVDQPLLAVETEKAVVEIPSPQAGHIGKLLAQVGEHVKVGSPLLEFEDGRHPESGTVVGELAGPVGRRSVSPPSARNASAASWKNAPVIRAAPAVRARAHELGVELSQIMPTGPDGTITLADVQAAATGLGARLEPKTLRGARRTMAINMARAWREVAHATLQGVADIEPWPPNEDVTCRLVRAVIAGCKVEPAFNASFNEASLSLNENATINLGIAIESADGLFVPVLRDVGHTTAKDWRRQIDALKRGVQDRSLPPSDFRGATISLSNFGTIVGRHASLIVVPPQVAILGVGQAFRQATQLGNGIALHRALPLSLTFDHRAVTGGMAARFLRAVIEDTEAAL